MPSTHAFSSKLRTETRTSHQEAEDSPFVSDLLAGRLSQGAYAALLEQLVVVYASLDAAAAAHREDPRFGGFFDPMLEREEALASDLAVLGPSGVELTAATTAYCVRLSEVAGDPLLVLAHHYTRYLGDLSGGQAIAAILRRTMSLTPEAGLAFYQFDVGPIPPYKRAYRELMDLLELDDDEQARLAAEANTAFALNTDLFASLAAVR